MSHARNELKLKSANGQLPESVNSAPRGSAEHFRQDAPGTPALEDIYGVWGSATQVLHAGREVDGWAGSLVTPIVPSTTYVQRAGLGEHKGHCYSRVSNPTVDALEKQLGALEGAPPAVCFATGLAAETALFLALLKSGDHAVIGTGVYGGTTRLFQRLLSQFGVRSTFVDTSDLDAVSRAIEPSTKFVFAETPSNPTLQLTDIEALSRVTRAAGVRLLVDNTFLTPIVQKPLDLGADVTVYSTTKHIEGHSSAMGGSVISRDVELLDRVRFIRKCTGAITSPWQAWCTQRGLATLALRIREHSRNALRVARYLSEHPRVARVNYPGLEDAPGYELACRQHLEGLHGGVISFELEGGLEATKPVLSALKLWALVEHVGSVESLVTHPATMTHADVPREQRLEAGITDGLIRLSVGIEDAADLIADLEQALATTSHGGGARASIATSRAPEPEEAAALA
ncbi:MAG: PLP-dependent aspartate aminotransferase family protein [Planctomycetota bacterium]|nr:PLP-dependent aspartate aminotransferase family protein [Planctomycetota bacterium]